MVKIVILILTLIGCTTEYVVTVNKTESKSILINSNIDSAYIFINNKITSYKTPYLLKDITSDSINIALFYPGIDKIKDTTIFFNSNTTKQINLNLDKSSDTSSVYITSFPTNADCIIDGYNFGQTPISIKGLHKDNHKLTLIKGNYKKDSSINNTTSSTFYDTLLIEHKPLIEHFLNISCSGCSEADEIINKFSNYNIIAYNANYPSKNDPFYNYNPSQINTKLYSYMPRSLPAIYVDGEAVSFSSINELQANLQNRLSQTTTANISIEFIHCEMKNDSIIGSVSLDCNIDSTTLNISLIENSISFSTPPGNNGMTHFYNEFREYKTYNYFKNSTNIFNFKFSIKELSSNDFKIVAYITKNSKILQSNSSLIKE